ncbi:hydroxyacid dehydrogenase [Pararobbsia silviterrae]|uniref:Hydroxyacid dehydrogenase n=1 Tax=Pararobbsia silviterrae TaxID=1792498 RepID=A0A494XDQ1_9BURK|nr:hydroxyacid dehydrogenase [Pararobbsia silviterrae]RKP46244.1 hydroxyacid dehydrogenase [Pararobbsia silviterrae]
MPDSRPLHILLAPAPRIVTDIFDEADLARLRALGSLAIHEDGPMTDDVFNAHAHADIIVGQFDMPAERLQRAKNLRAIINVEGNFLPNVDYPYCFGNGVRVLNVSPVFAEPVAELALGMAIDLARGVSRSDRRFRDGTEHYGLDANRDAFSLYRQDIGFVGMGDLGRAILPLLAPFGVRVRAYDPWLPSMWIESLGCEAASLETVLRMSKLVFVVASVTDDNQGLLDATAFAMMPKGAALVLVSRAGVVDFDAMLDFAAQGHIRVATDVFPSEPVPRSHRMRDIDRILLSPHQAGALAPALREIGKRTVADAELIARGLPPVMCKIAQPETVARFRSTPVAKS